MAKTYQQTANVDEKGELQSYVPATPLTMTCEFTGCTKTEGWEYVLRPGEEPIFLCDEHASKTTVNGKLLQRL